MECEGRKRRRRVEAGNRRRNRDAGNQSFMVEGVPVNPDGEGRHEQVQAKSSRRESEAPGEEGEEVKSPKRKVIRVESEETQDYVREAKGLSQEEAEEISFVLSAIRVPQKPLFRCDNRQSQKPSVSGSLRRW